MQGWHYGKGIALAQRKANFVSRNIAYSICTTLASDVSFQAYL